MQDINIKFKDCPPEKTVERIQGILDSLGLKVEEHWKDTGIENCWSLHLNTPDFAPLASNGKGITKALARASAYGEYIERIQCGLMLYKFQSIARDKTLYLPYYAPDGKYMTMQELIENGDWMDYLIRSYGGDLTREKIAQRCRDYACADEDAIWTVPYYSVFEDKYVYIPTAFAEQIYITNGCCAGNTREEAWIHALSEIMERHSTISIIVNGKSAPEISEDVLRQFPVVTKILDTIRENPNLDVKILDFSEGRDYPIVGTRVINKQAHGYHVNIAADPILEIAIDRSLTETFQGKQLHTVGSLHGASTFDEVSNFPMRHNVFNQLEMGTGLFGIDFFTDEVTSSHDCSHFTDHRNKSNKELLEFVLGIYKDMQYPVYVRNCSFMGFPSYHFIVPGFSEGKGLELTTPICDYALGDRLHSAFRNIEKASPADLLLLLSFHKKIATMFSQKNHFARLSGLPMDSRQNVFLTHITLAYAAYQLKKLPLAMEYLRPVLSLNTLEPEVKDYFRCVNHYLNLRAHEIPAEKIRLLLQKFYLPESTGQLFGALDSGKTPFDAYLMRCDTANCGQCRYQENCSYTACCKLFENIGEHYRAFTDGQDLKNFKS